MNKKLWINYTKLREALDFVSVLQHYDIDCDTRRNQVKITCPFHDDKTPSCSINIADSKFNCFGCDAKGNVLEFVVQMEGGDPHDKDDLYQGALTSIEILGLSPADFGKSRTRPQGGRQEGNKRGASSGSNTTGKPQKSSSTRHREANQSKPEPKSNPVIDISLNLDQQHPYITETKSLDEETIETFGIGYCNRGIMKNRIAIPIHNRTGELVAYAGRYASDDIPDGTIRYKLPSNFHKSFELFNLHRAMQFKKRHLVLVEGYWSTFRLHMAGIPVVGLMGRTISPEQANLIAKSGFRFVTLLLDGDEEGQNAIPGALDILGRKVYTRALELSDGIKPDTMPKEKLDELR